MPNALQERAMAIKLKKIQEGKPIKMGEVMREAGYTVATSRNPQQLEKSESWQALKEKYLKDELAVKTLNELASAENEDKDNRLKASTEILKLKDRYPAQKSKVLSLFGMLDELEEWAVDTSAQKKTNVTSKDITAAGGICVTENTQKKSPETVTIGEFKINREVLEVLLDSS